MKKVFVISNNCFSKTNSNGRTLGNLFYSYDKSLLAQFYISGEPDYDFCVNYFKISDIDVVNSILPNIKVGKSNNHIEEKTQSAKKRNVKNMILRELAWGTGVWKTKAFVNWIDDFTPEAILLQMGDCSFMIKIALWAAKRFNAQIYIYNSEAYYFKNYNYFRDGNDFLYGIFINNYRKWAKRIICQAEMSIYLCNKLKTVYDNEFHRSSTVIYNSSSIQSTPLKVSYPPVVSYIGNFSLGRDVSLCLVADCLQRISPDFHIDVYGNATEENLKHFNRHIGVRYRGFVDYDQIQQVIENSTILIHVESFDEFYIKDSEYGFSGKIADSLASGRVFLIYAPKNIACVQYLQENGVDVTASTDTECERLLLKYLNSMDESLRISNKEVELARINHNLIDNSRAFTSIINDGESN